MSRTLSTTGVVAIMAVALAVAGCKGGAAPRQAPPVPVRVSPAVRINAPITVQASGVVEALQTVSVTAQVTGSLLDVLFREGEFVQKGQILFHIDPRPLQAAVDQAKANLARDQAQAEADRRDDVRYSKLADMGYVSRSQADQVHATAMAAAASVEADRAALRSAEVNLGFATLRAPIAGRTGSLLVRRGNNVSPSSGPLVIINQISPVLVRFPVLQQDFAPLQQAVGVHPLPVTAVASDSTQATESGTMSFLDNAVDSLTGTITGKAYFPNAARRMWPGELVYLTVQLSVQRGVIAIPNAAVQTGQQGPYVYVVSAQNVVQTRTVVPGLQVGDMTVIQRGLAAGERVVTDGQSRVNPGQRVAIVTGGAPGQGTDTDAASLGAGGFGATGAAAGDVAAARAGTDGAVATPGGSGGAGASANPSGVSSGASPNAAAGRPAPSTSTVTGTSINATGTTGTATTTSPTTGTAPTVTPTTPGAGSPAAGTPTTGTPAPGAPGATGTPGTGSATGTTGRPPGTTGTTGTTGRPPGGTTASATRRTGTVVAIRP